MTKDYRRFVELPKHAAERLAKQLDEALTASRDLAETSGRFAALSRDTFGLLRGIHYTSIDSSQPRIASNLIEMISIACSNSADSPSTPSALREKLVTELLGLLSDVSASGLTSEAGGIPFDPQRQTQR